MSTLNLGPMSLLQVIVPLLALHSQMKLDDIPSILTYKYLNNFVVTL
jgi:hypothetical protein